jgi:hypothetical protein
MLYQAALTILKLNEQRIWDVKDSIDTLQILQSTPKRMIDCDQFIKVNRFLELSNTCVL